MGAVIFGIVFILVFVFLIITNIIFLFKGIFEKPFEYALDEFDKNKKAFDELDISDNYKLGSGHIYE